MEGVVFSDLLSLFLLCVLASRNRVTAISRELILPMLAMEEQQLYRTLSTGWRAVLGMDVMQLSSLQTALYVP